MQSLAELRAAEREVVRDWQWLHDALNLVARVRAENGDAPASDAPTASHSFLESQCLGVRVVPVFDLPSAFGMQWARGS